MKTFDWKACEIKLHVASKKDIFHITKEMSTFLFVSMGTIFLGDKKDWFKKNVIVFTSPCTKHSVHKWLFPKP